MSAAPADLPAGTIAHVSGRGAGRVLVTSTRAGYRITAGPPGDRGAQVTFDADMADVRRFVDDVLEHLRTRTGTRRSVPFEESFPASARLMAGPAELNLYDDGDTFSVMARDGGEKAGTGAFATLTGVQDFARDLDRHLAA